VNTLNVKLGLNTFRKDGAGRKRLPAKIIKEENEIPEENA